MEQGREEWCPYEPYRFQCLKGDKKKGEEEVYLLAAAAENMPEQYGDLHEKDPPWSFKGLTKLKKSLYIFR